MQKQSSKNENEQSKIKKIFDFNGSKSFFYKENEKDLVIKPQQSNQILLNFFFFNKLRYLPFSFFKPMKSQR